MAIPTDIAGLQVWFKADALALSDGDPVTSWTDSSGNARHAAQATGSQQPIYKANQLNGLPSVRFDGSDDLLVTPDWASPTAGVSIFAVAYHPGAITAFSEIVNHPVANGSWMSPYGRYIFRVNSSGNWEGGVQDLSVGTNSTTGDASIAATWQMHSFVYDQTNMTIYRGGVQTGQLARTGLLTSSTTGLCVGNIPSPSSESWPGDIGELIVYDSGLSTADRQAVEAYLTARWFTPVLAPTFNPVPFLGRGGIR